MTVDPGMSDTIVDGTDTFQVVRAEKDPIAGCWHIHCMREGVR